MCTIGNCFYNYRGYMLNSFFKQCDLTTEPTFLEPKVERGEGDVQYFAMKRRKKDSVSESAWAGVNNYGVSFVAADAYMDKGKLKMANDAPLNGKSVFDMYLDTIKKCTSGKQAAELACKFYREEFKEPDIFMVGDAKRSYFIEAYDGNVMCIERENGFFASTNHFRMIYGGVPYTDNHSTYLRLNRAEQVLQAKPDLDGIGDVLRDSYYGKTVWSICRYKEGIVPEEEAYYTQAAVIFTIIAAPGSSAPPQVICEYVLMNNPSVRRAGFKQKVFPRVGERMPVEYIGKMENLMQLGIPQLDDSMP